MDELDTHDPFSDPPNWTIDPKTGAIIMRPKPRFAPGELMDDMGFDIPAPGVDEPANDP